MRSLLGRFHRPMSRGLVNNMLTMNNLGDGSTLSLDFTTGVLDPRLTFTRSTTATYINSSGYVTSAAINDPRFDYSPTTVGSPRGLLIEGQATSLTKFSEAFTNAYWNTTANNVTAADSVATSPTGVALTASTLTEIAGTVSRHVHQLVGEFTPAASTAYTMSCFVKQPTSNAIRYVQLVFWSAGFGLTAYMNYDLQTGTVGTGGAGITASSITAYPNGWYRITATATSVAVPGVSGFQLGFSTTSGAVRTESYTASAPLKSIELFGAQVEIGFGASSYISTGASQVTRNADQVVLSNLPSMAFSQSAGTVYSQVEIMEKLRAVFVPYGSFDTSGGGRGWWWLRHNHDTSVGQRILGTAFNSVGSTGIGSSNYTHSSGVFKFATSLDTSVARMVYVINGGSAQTTTATGFALATAAQLSLNKNNDVGATDLGSMWIRTIKYWPTALPDAQLTSITS